MRDPKGRFLPGTSGNPSGSPGKKAELTEALRDYLAAGKRKQQLVKAVFDKAKSGDIQAIRLCFNYLDGLPVTRLDEDLKYNLIQDPEWITIRSAIFEILVPHPDLKEELIRRLKLDDENGSPPES